MNSGETRGKIFLRGNAAIASVVTNSKAPLSAEGLAPESDTIMTGHNSKC